MGICEMNFTFSQNVYNLRGEGIHQFVIAREIFSINHYYAWHHFVSSA